ncbi:hypothetical protein [Euzebya tangerina]|uniref:hypothetical protein n=1 Tax=Euzebya tangerina TaxID=591198 RepID=UPI000E322988|nr:hypothetical protein [Euzebya tangerina]
MIDTSSDFGPAPLDAPAVYPGRWPGGPVEVTHDQVVPLRRPLDPLQKMGRTPVLAIGSNACPAQLQRKSLGDLVYLTPVTIRNHVIVYAGHLTRYGAVPATPMRWAGARSEVFIAWLTQGQQITMDQSENGNYQPVLIPTEAGPMAAYRAVTGILQDDAGHAIRLASVTTHGPNLPRAMTQAEVQDQVKGSQTLTLR